MSNKTVVDANKRSYGLNFKELFAYRDLFSILAYRDFRVRYAQTFLGFIWALAQPLATLFIFIIVFGRAIKVDTGNVPYPLFAVCGMASWTYFSFVLNQSGQSIINSQEMIKKIYFPRVIIPLSKALVGFVDYGISLIFIIVLVFFYQVPLSDNIIYLPVFILLTIITSLAVGIWLSSLTIRYRDFQHVIPFLVQFGLYATPVAYPAKLIIQNQPEWVKFIYYLNPMVGVVEGFRWSVLGGESISSYSLVSFTIILVIFVLGGFYFKRVERFMADYV